MASSNVLKNIQRLISITNTGLAFSKDPFDQERYQDIRAILQDFVREATDLNPQELSDLFRQTDHYDTPLIDVRAWIVKDDKLCLVKGQGEETWALPGGFGEVGYSPKENILKEIQEETGYLARVNRLLAVFDTNRYQLQSRQYVKLVFECELLDGSFQQNQEISDLVFFEREKMPALSTKRNTEEQLNFLWEVYDGKRDLYCD